ncbi:helix-turn-helix domain-containing protein [Bdellovibrio sp. HCB-110]|uniref:helix-turn-helix domain-containing protein n=1 Tax=Bdellovibrio sp. HCB-110 TaxID=3391182 RepID=UPI0039B37E22
MMRHKKQKKNNDDEGLWLTNVEFNGRADKAFVKTQLTAISSKIATYRKMKNMSQETLAELACVSVATIKFIEQKQRVPSLVVLLKIIYVIDKETTLWP